MATINVWGFPGSLSSEIVDLRMPGQSKTCQERGAKLEVANDDVCDIAFMRLDKGFFAEGDACDYSISQQKDSPKGMLLELKGVHARHAVAQLSGTLLRLRSSSVTVIYKTAVVASRRGNNIPNSEWMKSVKIFKKQGVTLIRSGSDPQMKVADKWK